MRIAYVSHVDSRWIKQRPHFIAEAMNQKCHEVTYVCSGFVRRKFLVKGQRLGVPVVRIPMLPQKFRRALRLLDPVASAISALVMIALVRPQVVIFTHSRHFRLARYVRCIGVRVFYDCMDLNGLFSDATSSETADERRLVAVSERTFCSSKPIADHIRNVLPEARVDVVHNALDPLAFDGLGAATEDVLPGTLGYVGAISAWFDFDAVVELLAAEEKLSLRLWGPCDAEIPVHDRIHYMGILPHGAAIQAMQSCSVLLLPFKVTDLIKAVDPVKVYEYIATGRPVVACDYPQLEHFGDLISRYSCVSELIARVQMSVNLPTRSESTTGGFIASNSWTIRAEKMLDGIG